jgi:hypothetical protein
VHAVRGDAAALLRRETLRAIAADPQVSTSLERLEAWLEGETSATAALPLASGWSLPAAALDLETVRYEAVLYIEAYPPEARVIGNLAERCATWMAQRIAMTVVPAERLPAVRRAIGTLADTAAPTFPSAAGSLREVAAQSDDETLWYQLSLHVAQSEMDRRGW